jgi:uncharacterized membrane protein YkoI
MFAISAALAFVLMTPHSVRATGTPCLPASDTQDLVDARKVIAPGMAVLLARRTVPTGEVLRATLCRTGDRLIYLIMVLRNDGRLMRVTIDAPSGKVEPLR